MQNAENVETVERERERERERAAFLNKVAYVCVALENIFYGNKDPCYGLRLLYLRI